MFDEASGRGLAVPIGIGAVLMGWGLHLFFLARAARPVMAMVPIDPGYDLHDEADHHLDGLGNDHGYGSGYGGSGYGAATGYGASGAYSSFSSYDDYDDEY